MKLNNILLLHLIGLVFSIKLNTKLNDVQLTFYRATKVKTEEKEQQIYYMEGSISDINFSQRTIIITPYTKQPKNNLSKKEKEFFPQGVENSNRITFSLQSPLPTEINFQTNTMVLTFVSFITSKLNIKKSYKVILTTRDEVDMDDEDTFDFIFRGLVLMYAFQEANETAVRYIFSTPIQDIIQNYFSNGDAKKDSVSDLKQLFQGYANNIIKNFGMWAKVVGRSEVKSAKAIVNQMKSEIKKEKMKVKVTPTQKINKY
jgi:hypothetical protein